MRLTAAGNLGIGTNNPAGMLDVSGDAYINGLRIGTGAGLITSNTVLGLSALSLNTTGAYNTAIGALALSRNLGGTANTALGNDALRNNTSGYYNTAVGWRSLSSNTSGYYNTAVGVDALKANLGGGQNTAVGYASMQTNTSGASNIALGWASLSKNTTGGSNSAVGHSALFNNTTGAGNTAVGRNALYSNETGVDNTAIGFESLYYATGSANTGVGAYSLGKTTSGQYNSALGRAALWYNTTGGFNTASGYRSLYGNSTGNHNVSVGFYGLHFAQTSSNSIALGSLADYYSPTTAPVATVVPGSGLGIGAYGYRVSFVLDGVETVPGAYSTSVTTTSGNQQINLSSIPTYSGPKTITARKIYRIPANGENLWYHVATINDNITTTYTDNTPDGNLGSQPTDPSGSIMIGRDAKAFQSNQLVIGSNVSRVTDAYIGGGVYDTSPLDITLNATGGSGTDVNGANFIFAGGKGTGAGVGGSLIFKTASSSSSGSLANSLIEVMRITSDGKVGIGTTTPTAQLTTTGTVRFANFGAGTIQTDASGNLSVSSDINLKDLEGTYEKGLTEILGIEPILYRWNEASGYDRSTVYAGFSAQNIEAYLPEAVGTDPHGFLTLSDRPILAALVNAIKELWEVVSGNTKKIEALEARVLELEAASGRPTGSPTTTDTPLTTSTLPIIPVPGCTDSEADNFAPEATEDDGSCLFTSTDPPVGAPTGTSTDISLSVDSS